MRILDCFVMIYLARDGVVNRTVSFRYYANRPSPNVTIQVKNCKSFFVYKLPKPPKNRRYCGSPIGSV